MCTLTYIPTDQGFLFTSNRDEKKRRATALAPASYTIHDQEVVFPKDGAAGGTWFAASDTLKLCLLNGAFTGHIPSPPYRLSRGLVLLDAFGYSDFTAFYHEYSFTGIEPFTLVAIDTKDEKKLHELRWDGIHTFLRELDAIQAQIWSSATLYPEPVRKKRKEWFREFLAKHPIPSQEDILEFHQFSGEGDKSIDLVMERNDTLQTLSVSSLKQNEDSFDLHYLDLVEGSRFHTQSKQHVPE